MENGKQKTGNDELLNYAKEKLKENGLDKIPASAMFSCLDLEAAKKVFNGIDMDIVGLFSIGFANGVKYKSGS